jgi:penicillin-binding protein 2
MVQAIAVSCDVYFYEIGGGYQNQKGLGIANIEKYSKLFGFGDPTGIDLPSEKEGIIPSPEWKIANFKGDPWRIGDTYHTAIGQYGFQVTPMEMARAVGAIANSGKLLTPHLILGDTVKEKQITVLDLKKDYFNIVQEGMRQAVSTGTAVSLNVPYVEVAAKTGTAQLGVAKNKVNSWVIGFFPYKNPKYAFAIMMEAGPSTNGVGASSIMRQLLDWMSTNTPEYFK